MDTNTRIRLFSASMARTNYTPPRPRKGLLDLPLTVVTVIVLAYLLSHVGPAIDGVVAEVEAEQEAKDQLQREQRRIRAMQAMCGGENAVYAETADGSMRCVNKRGLVTVVAGQVKQQPQKEPAQ